jgi:hypothetical protein
MKPFSSLFRISLFMAGGISGAIAQADNYCTNYSAQMTPDTLYVEMTCPKEVKAETKAKCLVAVTSTTQIQKAKLYTFLYKTPQSGIQNSLVVIQLKGIASRPVPKPVAVHLTRQQLSFACFSSHGATFPNDAFPGAADRDAVDYDKYDQFHRYGFAPKEDRKIFLKFHTNYSNGSECVSTLEAVRRAQFLFADRTNVASLWVALWTQYGLGTPEAVAADINQYDDLRVVLANYKKQPQTSGCVSFVGQSDGTALEIALSDLEEKVRTPNLLEKFTPKIWVINTR